MAPPVRLHVEGSRVLLDPDISLAEVKRTSAGRLRCDVEQVVIHVKDPEGGQDGEMWEVEGEAVFRDAASNRQAIYASRQQNRAASASQKRRNSISSNVPSETPRKRGRPRKEDVASRASATSSQARDRQISASRPRSSGESNGSRVRKASERDRAGSATSAASGSASGAEQRSSKKAWQRSDLQKLWKYFVREAEQMPSLRRYDVYSLDERNALLARIIGRHPHTTKGRNVAAIDAQIRNRVNSERAVGTKLSPKIESLYPVSRRQRAAPGLTLRHEGVASSSRITVDALQAHDLAQQPTVARGDAPLPALFENRSGISRTSPRYYENTGVTLRAVNGGSPGAESNRISSYSQSNRLSRASSSSGSDGTDTEDDSSSNSSGGSRESARVNSASPPATGIQGISAAALSANDGSSTATRAHLARDSSVANVNGAVLGGRHGVADENRGNRSDENINSQDTVVQRVSVCKAPHSQVGQAHMEAINAGAEQLSVDNHDRTLTEAPEPYFGEQNGSVVPAAHLTEESVLHTSSSDTQLSDHNPHPSTNASADIVVKKRSMSVEEDELRGTVESTAQNGALPSVRALASHAIVNARRRIGITDPVTHDSSWAESLRYQLEEAGFWGNLRGLGRAMPGSPRSTLKLIFSQLLQKLNHVSPEPMASTSSTDTIFGVAGEILELRSGLAPKPVGAYEADLAVHLHQIAFSQGVSENFVRNAIFLVAILTFLMTTPGHSSLLDLFFKTEWNAELRIRRPVGDNAASVPGAAGASPILHPQTSEHVFRRMQVLLQSLQAVRQIIECSRPLSERAKQCKTENRGNFKLRHHAFERLLAEADCRTPHLWTDVGLFADVHMRMIAWNAERFCSSEDIQSPSQGQQPREFGLSEGAYLSQGSASNGRVTRAVASQETPSFRAPSSNEQSLERPLPTVRTRENDPSLFFPSHSQQSQTGMSQQRPMLSEANRTMPL